MIPAAPRTLLARLRSSARLAVLMLLVFALKIGTVAACAQHDFADMGLGTGGDHALLVSGTDGSDDPSMPLTSHAGACSHCSSHHAAALTPTATTFVVIARRRLDATSSGLPPSASPSLELRPPIA
jgi:hypothetical protein